MDKARFVVRVVKSGYQSEIEKVLNELNEIGYEIYDFVALGTTLVVIGQIREVDGAWGISRW